LLHNIPAQLFEVSQPAVMADCYSEDELFFCIVWCGRDPEVGSSFSEMLMPVYQTAQCQSKKTFILCFLYCYKSECNV